MSVGPIDLTELIGILPGYDPYAQAGDCHFDEAIARHHVEFVETCCTFSQGARTGQPFILEDWEKAIIANLHGWRKPDGRRRYRNAFVFVGRGNGKSELAAAEICDALFLDHEPGAQIYSAAGKRDQTRFVFDPVKKMILACPQMRTRAKIYKHAIVVGDRSYRSISREATTEHGGSTQFVVVDELHSHADRALLDVLETSMVKRRDPMMICLSTSDFEREDSPCNQLHDYACKVRDNLIVDPAFLPAIYQAEQEDDWTDPEVWRKANPNLGVTIEEAALAELCEKAKHQPEFECEFKRLHLNIRTAQAVRVLPIEKWDTCRGELPDLRGRRGWGGLDIGSTSDLTAFCAAFAGDPGRIILDFIFWVPEKAVQNRVQRGQTEYAVWASQGWIRVTPGD